MANNTPIIETYSSTGGQLSSNVGWTNQTSPNVGTANAGYFTLGFGFNTLAWSGTYNTVNIGTQGVITFGNGFSSNSTTAAGTPANDKIIVFNGNNWTNAVTWNISGTAPNRTFYAQVFGANSANLLQTWFYQLELTELNGNFSNMVIRSANVANGNNLNSITSTGFYSPSTLIYPIPNYPDLSVTSILWQANSGFAVQIPSIGQNTSLQVGDVVSSNIVKISTPNMSGPIQTPLIVGSPNNQANQVATNTASAPRTNVTNYNWALCYQDAFTMPNTYQYLILGTPQRTIRPNTPTGLKYPSST